MSLSSISTTYLAVNRRGDPVAAFDTPALGHAFIERQAERLVKLELVEQTTIRKPCRKRIATVSNVSRLPSRKGVEHG